MISVGARNDYGHPTRADPRDLRGAQVPTLRTDQGGSADIRVEAGRLTVRRIGPVGR